jgi:hypothetical protein
VAASSRWKGSALALRHRRPSASMMRGQRRGLGKLARSQQRRNGALVPVPIDIWPCDVGDEMAWPGSSAIVLRDRHAYRRIEESRTPGGAQPVSNTRGECAMCA